MPLPTDPWLYFIGLPTVFVIAVGKSAFGGGLAILGIPLLALTMDPLDAAVVVAPLVVGMDMVTMGTMGRASWSKPDLVWLLPGLACGIGIGALVFVRVDKTVVELAIALTTLAFTLHYFLRGRLDMGSAEPVSPAKAVAASITSGFTTFIAHAGGPPMALYLLRRGLDKTAYVATTVIVFAVGNLLKLIPYIGIGLTRPATLWTALALSPAIPIGVWAGRVLHDRLPQKQLMAACYALLAVAATQMLWSALKGLLFQW